MSGTAAVGNNFQAAVTATGLQLDQNYSTIVAYLNDPTNRNNYAADAGTTNTVVMTFAPPVVGGYTAGLELAWKWAATNSGGVVLNANGLGNISLVNPDGSPLNAGQGTAGTIGKAVYDGTRAIFIAPPSPATQAQMETATSSASFVTPSTMQHHRGVAKAWAVWNGTSTGTITPLASFNITSVARLGTGTYALTFGTLMSSNDYAVVGMALGGAEVSQDATKTPTTASVVLTVFQTSTETAVDRTRVYAICFGDQ